ncbi:hypothetical protein MNBD_IGNAVI01-881 [hydrothermal vent metagenome]|uniref:Uncharacterized protein n=1 Tax=hydrothermal vent metagenome TaxID=652676 RepID=A0A3B1CGQ7_9ZZZZ
MFEKFKYLKTFPAVMIIVILLISLFFQTLPLVSTLNFEFAASSAILLFISCGLLTIYFLRKYKNLGVLLPMVLTKYKLYLWLLFIPLIISIIFNLLFQQCPIRDGMIFYAVITIPAFYFGFVCGVFSFFINKKISYLLFIGSFLIFVIIPLFEFYFNPQIYFYNPIIGLFPGTIYDEEISISNTLLFYRFLNVIFFSILLYFTIKIGNKKNFKRYIFLASLVVSIIVWISVKPLLGFASTNNSIEKILKGETLSPNYKIVYPINVNIDKKRLFVLEHEYYYQTLKRKTDLTPSNLITSFIFENADQKGKLFGTKAANVAKPWQSQIYIDQYTLDNTLEHELTHIFAAEIGSTILKITPDFNFALLEGYAMAMENDYSGFDIDYLAYLANKSDYKINLENLFSKLNFFGSASSLSYIYAGSFIKYLVKEYGIKPVNEIYQDLDFQKHVGKDLKQLNIEYSSYLDSLNYPVNINRANYFFGYKPLIKKVCPREVAAGLKKAWQEYSGEKYISAKEKFHEVYSYSNSYSALAGIIYCNTRLGMEQESKEMLEKSLKDYEGTSSYFSALLQFGDQLILTNEIRKANSVYTVLANMKPTINYFNLAITRKALIIKNEKLASDYIRGSDFDKYSILKRLNNDELFEPSIPIMVKLSQRLNENSDLFEVYLDSKQNLDEAISSNTAFVLSKYFYQNYKFIKALHYAELSIEKCKEGFRISILKAHKDKIEWIIKNKDRILSETKFSVYN